MPYRIVRDTSGLEVELSGATLHAVMEAAAEAFTTAVTPLATVQPRLAEELDVDAPDLESLLVDFLTELLYRYDTRGWLTRFAEIEVHETEEGWTLEGTLRGERRPPVKGTMTAVAYEGLRVARHENGWTATVTLKMA
jgi:SHS2 domain-containing protein